MGHVRIAFTNTVLSAARLNLVGWISPIAMFFSSFHRFEIKSVSDISFEPNLNDKGASKCTRFRHISCWPFVPKTGSQARGHAHGNVILPFAVFVAST